MKKCDFCIKSSPNRCCFWACQTARENDCSKAIDKMVRALSGSKEICLSENQNKESE